MNTSPVHGISAYENANAKPEIASDANSGSPSLRQALTNTATQAMDSTLSEETSVEDRARMTAADVLQIFLRTASLSVRNIQQIIDRLGKAGLQPPLVALATPDQQGLRLALALRSEGSSTVELEQVTGTSTVCLVDPSTRYGVRFRTLSLPWNARVDHLHRCRPPWAHA